jgi:hypothetical protein
MEEKRYDINQRYQKEHREADSRAHQLDIDPYHLKFLWIRNREFVGPLVLMILLIRTRARLSIDSEADGRMEELS